MVGSDGTTDAGETLPRTARSRERTGGSDSRASPSRQQPTSDEVPLEFPEREPSELDDTTELHLMDRHADDDGTVTVQILGWKRDGDVVRVEYSLPMGETRHDRYRWPTPGRYDESDFVGLVRGLGYVPGSAEHIAGEFARARNENGRWRIVTGRETRGGRSDRPNRTDHTDRTDGRPSGETSAGSRTETDRFTPLLPRAVGRRLDGIDPMDIGMVSVLLVFLSVVVPAAAAIPAGGLTVPITVLGVLLFGAAVATLWLSIVVSTV